MGGGAGPAADGGAEGAESRAAEAAKAAVGRGLRGDEVVDAIRRAGVVLLPVHLDVARRQARLVAAHAALDAKYREDKKTYYFYDKTGRAYRIYNPRGLPRRIHTFRLPNGARAAIFYNTLSADTPRRFTIRPGGRCMRRRAAQGGGSRCGLSRSASSARARS